MRHTDVPLVRSVPLPRAVAPNERFAAVDGLRGVACLAVVAHHCYYAAGRFQWPFGFPRLLSYGYLGVEVFFVLSGFCLAYPLINRDPRRTDWWLYAKRRVRRIVPAFWAIVLLLLVASILIDRLLIPPFYEDRLLLVPTGRQFFLVSTFIAVWFNPVFWTLTIEARWYFLLPICVAVCRRFGSVVLFVVTLLLAAAYAQAEGSLSGRARLLCGPLPLYLPLFAIGIAAAALLRRHASPESTIWVNANRAGLLIAVVLIGVFTPAHPASAFQLSRLAPGGLLAATLLLAALYDPIARRILSTKLLTFIGLVSYSLYLIHLPIVQFSYAVTARLHWPEWGQLLFYEGVILPACVCAAYPFYVCFERPFLRLAPSRRTAVADLNGDTGVRVLAADASPRN